MWNPFTRKDSDERHAPPGAMMPTETGAPPPPRRRGQIAETEHIGPTAVVTLTVTELVGMEAAERLTDLLDELEATGATNFVLDVQNVQMMDSACVGTLVKAFHSLDRMGGRIALVNADRSVQYLFKLTKLDRLFPICSDVMAALATVERPTA